MKDDDSSRSQFEGNRNQGINTNIGTAIANARDIILNQSPPRTLSRHQLPADIADFTGRKDEIESIVSHLKAGETVAISAVAGMAGVGKSALAIHVAHQLAGSHFSDVQLYIDLRGTDGNALEPAEALAQFLRAFGLDESSIPQNLGERSGVFRSLLSGKRAIVVLDNARDEAQVRPLLLGSNSCAVIVTSRRVLGALEGATVVDLQVLPELKALEFLEKLIDKRRVQQELVHAKEIVQLCGQLPLAIRIVGGTLRTKRHWTLAEYAQRLADEKQRLDHLQLSDLDVRASFELSYRELSDQDALLFCYLGLLEGRAFGGEIAGVLMEVDYENAFERLVEAQLLEVSLDKRYRFHDLIQVFAKEKLVKSTSIKKQQAIKQKFVIWWVTLSRFYDKLLTPISRREMFQEFIEDGKIPSDFDEQSLPMLSLVWFEQEREHLLSAIAWANDGEMWHEVIALAENLLDFCQIRSYLIDSEQACRLAIDAAQKIKDKYREGIAWEHLTFALSTNTQTTFWN
jgi:NB-ARC domain